jgi:hypothetical protein
MMDPSVSNYIFHAVIEHGLASTTRMIAMNQLHLLPIVDGVIVLGDGCIVYQGAFSDMHPQLLESAKAKPGTDQN